MKLGPVWMLDLLLSGIGAVISLFLFVFYARRLYLFRSRYTATLFAFSSFFLAHNLLSVYSYLKLSSSYSLELALTILPLNIIEICALAALAFLAYQ